MHQPVMMEGTKHEAQNERSTLACILPHIVLVYPTDNSNSSAPQIYDKTTLQSSVVALALALELFSAHNRCQGPVDSYAIAAACIMPSYSRLASRS